MVNDYVKNFLVWTDQVLSTYNTMDLEAGLDAVCLKKHADKNFKALMNIEDKEQEIAERIIGNRLLVFVVEGLCDMVMCSVGSQVLFKQVSTPYAEHAWNVHQYSSHIELRGFAS